MSLLNLLIFLPAVTAIAVAMAPRTAARGIALIGAAVTFVVSLTVLTPSGGTEGVFYLYQKSPWLANLNLSYTVGVDAVAAWLVALTAFLSLAGIALPTRVADGRERAYYGALLGLASATIGAFCALDLVLFYIFFELCLVPVYFMIGLWGGPRRLAVAMKFFLYTVVGSLLMLAAVIYLYLQAGTSNIVELHAHFAQHPLPREAALLCFAGFAAAFAVKTPLLPFHTWQPDTYAETPTAGLIVLAGAMAKLGTYGFYRFGIGLLPEAARAAAPFFVWVGALAIVYGALVAVMQRDAKRVIAYSSISHLGFIILGLFALTPQGVSGAALQMVNHGITTGGIFLALGMLEERRGTLQLGQLGGLWEQLPRLSRMLLLLTLSALALPLTNGFVGEFLILLGAFAMHPAAAIVATTGAIWSAVYMLRFFQKAMYGPVILPQNRRLSDVGPLELGLLAPFVLLVFVLGVQPNLVLKSLHGSIARTIDFPEAVQTATETIRVAMLRRMP